MQNTNSVMCLFFCLVVSLSVSGCGGSGNSGGASSPSGTNPVIKSVTPSSGTAGSSDVSISVAGRNFISGSTVQWNGTPLATTYVSSTKLTAQIPADDLASAGKDTITVANPAPGGGTSAGLSFLVNSAMPPGETMVKAYANDLAWDPVNQVIYLSIPAISSATGDEIQALDPATGKLGISVNTDGEPNLLAVSKTSKYLYVGMDGTSSVQRLTLPGLRPDITIPLGSNPNAGPYVPLDIQAGPASDNTMAVVRGIPYGGPSAEGGVRIYDDGTARIDTLCGWGGETCPEWASHVGEFDSIQWNTDGSEMFAANYMSSGGNFYTIPVGSAGFGSVTDYPGVAGGDGDAIWKIHYDATTNRIYDDNGNIIDPDTGLRVGSFNTSGIMVPDGPLGKVFFFGQLRREEGSKTYTLESFDIHTLAPIATMKVLNVDAPPKHLIRWGNNGLAFTTCIAVGGYICMANPGFSGSVYLIRGSFVDGSASPMAGAAPTENVRSTWTQPTSKSSW